MKTTITQIGFDATTIKDLIAVTMTHSTSTRPTELMLVAHNTTFAVKLYQILSDPEDQHVSISGVAWQLAGREGAASWKLAEYRV